MVEAGEEGLADVESVFVAELGSSEAGTEKGASLAAFTVGGEEEWAAAMAAYDIGFEGWMVVVVGCGSGSEASSSFPEVEGEKGRDELKYDSSSSSSAQENVVEVSGGRAEVVAEQSISNFLVSETTSSSSSSLSESDSGRGTSRGSRAKVKGLD